MVYKSISNNKYTVPDGDTDSFVHDIKHTYVYEWMKENSQYFELSDNTRVDMQSNENQKQLVCFKGELKGCVMSEMLGLNPKSYVFRDLNIEKKKAKGVSQAVVDKLITFNDYKNTLETNRSFVRNVVRIRSSSQQLFTYKKWQHSIN